MHPFKAQIGHTLGAAGALESLAAIDAVEHGVAPASVCPEDPDPDAPANLLRVAEPRRLTAALKLSAAFGGANASILWSRTPLRAALSDAREVFVSRAVAVDTVPSASDLSRVVGQPAERLARADAPCFLALGALAKLRDLGFDLAGAGIVVGHAYGTLDVNEQYNRRILERGPRLVEPRRFPYTSPNGVAGECSVAFKLTGPNLAVGAGLYGAIEALAVAADLVRGSHCDRIVVVAVDAPGAAATACAKAAGWPLPRVGAVALLVSCAREGEGARRVAGAWLSSGGASPEAPLAAGHDALLPLLSPATRSLRVRTPLGGAGFVELED